MAEIVGVRFRKSCKIYHFVSSEEALKLGDEVVVETASGVDLGRVVVFINSESIGEASSSLKQVLRLATADDKETDLSLRAKETEAMIEAAKVIAAHKMAMKLIAAEYNLDATHLTIFFSADGRVDFRELVRDLSRNLKVRVELRQIGPRDESKMLGGFGRCGREHCCATFLDDFSPVSIKMAKVQDLPLNPAKISGVCGRLLCCLGYECEQYRVLKEKMPRVGQSVMTDSGQGVVVGQNTLEETVLVEIESGARLTYPVSKVKLADMRREEPR